MRMRFVITGEYDLEDSLAERLNNYGTTDPAECAAVDMQHKPGEWLYLSHTRVTMFHIEPAEGDGDDSRGDRPDSPAPGTPGLPSGNPVPVGPGLASYDPSINWPVIPGGSDDYRTIAFRGDNPGDDPADCLPLTREEYTEALAKCHGPAF